jgi:hypothetical protein
MGLLARLGLEGKRRIDIDWELTPADTFGIFESWGGKERVRSDRERLYYFYIDGWEDPPRLLFMERGIKYARVLAEITAPREMLDRCIARQGKGLLDKSYAIDSGLRQWLLANVIDTSDDSLIEPAASQPDVEESATGLPGREEPAPAVARRPVRHQPAVFSEEELPRLIRAGGFFDSRHNPEGSFANHLVDNGDGLTVTDLVTGVTWQRGGCDIGAIRQVQQYVKELNRDRFAGHVDWRLPTLEEALALLEPVRNDQGLHLHPCFSATQPFIFLADERQPGGYWFIDFKQGTVFWASGTIPGGFGRVCRTG